MSSKKETSKKMTMGEIASFLYRKVVLQSALLHLIITMVMMIVGEKNAITLDRSFLILTFSVAVSFSNLIFSLRKMNILLRTTLHFICLMLSFALIMLVGSGNMESNTSGSTLLLVVFAVCYLLIAPIPIYLKHKKEKSEDEPVEYKSIYKK